MSESPMELVRTMDETVTALLELARQVRQSVPEVADEELRNEMLESAAGLERRAGEMAEATERLRVQIN